MWSMILGAVGALTDLWKKLTTKPPQEPIPEPVKTDEADKLLNPEDK